MNVQDELKQFDVQVADLTAKQVVNDKRVAVIQSENLELRYQISDLLEKQHTLFLSSYRNSESMLWPFLLTYYPDSRIKSLIREQELSRLGLRFHDAYFWRETNQFRISIGLFRADEDANRKQLEAVKTLLPYITPTMLGLKWICILSPWNAPRSDNDSWWLECLDNGRVRLHHRELGGSETFEAYSNLDAVFAYIQANLYFQE